MTLATDPLDKAVGEYASAAGHGSLAERIAAAQAIHDALAKGPVVPAVHTLTLASLPMPSRLLFGHAVRAGAEIFAVVTHRALLVQYFARDANASQSIRTLLWNPTDVRRALHVPALSPVRKGIGRIASALALQAHASVDTQLALHGLSPDAVDVVAFDQLDGQYPSGVVARFPRARLAITPVEWSRYIEIPRRDRAFMVPGPEIDRARIQRVEEARVLGAGLVLVRTGGRREGHQSLVVNTAAGVLVASGNSFGLDGYAPRISKLPGLASYARERDTEFVPAFPAIGSEASARAAMAIERALADRLPNAPAFPFVLPTLELSVSAIALRLRPAARAPELAFGTISRDARPLPS